MNAQEYAKSVNGVAITGQVQIKAGNRPGEGIISTQIDKDTAASHGISRGGTVSCYMDLGDIQAVVESVKLPRLAIGTLIVTDLKETVTKFMDDQGRPKTRISAVLLNIMDVKGGIPGSTYDWNRLQENSVVNARLAQAASSALGN